MASVVIDTNVLLAARLERDANNDRGRAIVNAVDAGELPAAYVPSDVVTEVLNYLHERATHAEAIATLDALVASKGLELVHTPKSDFDAGRSLFRRYDGLSFADAVIAAFMERQGVEFIYSFDDDFDVLPGLVRVNTATDPFD